MVAPPDSEAAGGGCFSMYAYLWRNDAVPTWVRSTMLEWTYCCSIERWESSMWHLGRAPKNSSPGCTANLRQPTDASVAWPHRTAMTVLSSDDEACIRTHSHLNDILVLWRYHERGENLVPSTDGGFRGTSTVRTFAGASRATIRGTAACL